MEPRNRWHRYFYNMTNLVASNSQCLSRKLGAVITLDNSIISTGYNGPPRKVPRCDQRYDFEPKLAKAAYDSDIALTVNELDGRCPRQVLGYRSGEALNLCPATHAEANAIANAARMGTQVRGATMWVNCEVPCKNCLGLIINAGIVQVVVKSLTYYDDLSQFLVKQSGLYVLEYI